MKNNINIRLLRKLAVDSKCAKTRSAEPQCTLVHEDSSNESTKHFESTVEFPKKSIELIDNLTVNTVQAVRDRLLCQIKNNQVEAVSINLSGVKICDTSGIALLVDMKRLCGRHVKRLEFIKIPEKIVALANFYEVAEILI